MSESQHTEYKQSWHDDYLKWICIFAKANGGVIIGKNDEGQGIHLKDYENLIEFLPGKTEILWESSVMCNCLK